MKKNKLSWKSKIGYGLGDFGGCMTFTLMGDIFIAYCTDALGINTILLGTLLLVWNIWDFINDPIMGALMDKSFAKNRNIRGKFRPWLLRAAPLICVAFIALWTVPQFFDGIALIGVLIVLKICYEAAYTMFNIPMGSLLSSMSRNDEERASLSSWRGIGSGIGNAIPAALAPVFIKMYGDTNATGYAIGAIICAVIGLVGCLLHYYLTEEKVVVEENTNQEKIKMSDIINVFKVNRPFVALCLHGLFICLMQYSASSLGFYMYKDVLGNETLKSMAVAVSAPFMGLIFVFGSKLAKKFGLEKMIRVSVLAGSLLYISLFLVQIITNINPYLYIIWSGVAMGMASVAIYLQWGLVGEAIDYNEMITGKRTEGSIYGTFNLSRRVGQTIATSLAVYALGWFGYNGNLDVQPDSAIFGIKLLCVLLPGIFALGSYIAFKFIWNIDDKKRKEISEFKYQEVDIDENN
jgi:GPH family glycoside/pentoside/hexuronide:cation symporter